MRFKINILILLIIILPSFAIAELHCSVKETCLESEVNLFQMTGLYRAHASLDGTHPYKVCCGSDDTYISNECSGEFTEVLRLYRDSNSHVQNPMYKRFDERVCLSVDDAAATITCEYKKNYEDCSDGYSCVASVSWLFSGMVAECTGDKAYSNKVCCKTDDPYWCYQCGAGFNNNCDREECNNLEEGCHFNENLGSCSSCNESSGCESYGDDSITCSNDPCGYGNCGMTKKFDFYGREIDVCSNQDSCYFDKYGAESYSSFEDQGVRSPEDYLHIDEWSHLTVAEVNIPGEYSGNLQYYKIGPNSSKWHFVSNPPLSEELPFRYEQGDGDDFIKRCLEADILCEIEIVIAPGAGNEGSFTGLKGDLDNVGYINGNVDLHKIKDNERFLIKEPRKEPLPIIREEDNMIDILHERGTDTEQSNNLKIVPHETKVGDHICDNGIWTTRTKKLASSIVKIAGNNDYVLYCDTWNNVLPYAENIDDEIVERYISGMPSSQILKIIDESGNQCEDDGNYPYPCTNNYCVMRFLDKTIVGTTLNKAIDDKDSFLWGVMGVPSDYCSDLDSFDSFEKCSNDDNIWYNRKYNAIIYSEQGISSVPNPDETEGVINFLVDSFKNIITNIKEGKFSSRSPTEIEEDFIDRSARMNKLYVNNKDERMILASSEIMSADGKPVLTVSYPSDITVDNICQSIHSLPGKEMGIEQMSCMREENEFRITSTNYEMINSYWQDLTSSLRLVDT